MKTRITLLALLVLCCACGDEAADAPAMRDDGGPLEVLVVNHPLQYFAERIGGEHVRVVFPAPRDGDPAYWSPRPEDVARYQQAGVILLNGAGYAKWVEHATLPPSRVVVTAAAAKRRFITITGGVTHSHGADGEHAHEGLASTTWIDPEIAVMQAEAIEKAFARWRPEHRADFAAGLEALRRDLMALDAELERIFAAHETRPLVASHPVYQYLVERYGLDIESVHWEPNATPDAEGWRELDEILAAHPATLMIWEAQPSDENVAALAARGIASVVFDPCANVPQEGDYLTVMKQNATAMREALE